MDLKLRLTLGRLSLYLVDASKEYNMLSQVSSKQDLSLRIMGIDPGTENLGMSLGVCDFITPNFNIIDATTFDIKTIIHKSTPYLVEFQSRNIALHNAIYNLVYQMVGDLQPDLVICESPYMDKRFPLSYMLLSLCCLAIEKAVRDYSIFIPFELVDPATAKMGVGAKGNSGNKELMREAVLNNKLITGSMDLNQLDEHSIDAIAIAACGFLGVLTR